MKIIERFLIASNGEPAYCRREVFIFNMLTSQEVAHFLRHLYVPLALRRCRVARLICEARQGTRLDDQLHAEDIGVVQDIAVACLEAVESEARTLRGATQRSRQAAILLRYEVKGEPRESVAADLGISRRQFYRERERALGAYAALLSDRIQADRSKNQGPLLQSGLIVVG